ncbi:MAG TPA: hypothetical protein VHD81_11435 [Mycobacteriales bacterium]|nr:hypothetical protein [Mycobacteriales bacterium]
MDDWGQSSRPDPTLGIAPPSYAEYSSRPSIEGRDALRYAMSELDTKKKEPKRRRFHWPKWLTWKRTVALVIVDLILAHFAWNWLMTVNQDAVTKAIQHTMTDASHHDWSGVYDSLCKADRAQVDEADLATAGDAAMAQLGLGLDHATVTSINKVDQSIGPIGTAEAAQVHGELVPVSGDAQPYSVVLVHEIPGGWKVCMSAGGFSMLGYTEPLGSSSFTP